APTCHEAIRLCSQALDLLALGCIVRNGAHPANQAGRHADLVVRPGHPLAQRPLRDEELARLPLSTICTKQRSCRMSMAGSLAVGEQVCGLSSAAGSSYS
ncbi:MAG: hypothetical protein WAQ05_14225, partial [Rubrivivax sp.]